MANLILQTNVLPQPAAWSDSSKRGGHLTYVLHWLHGLKRLGHRVVLLNHARPDSSARRDDVYFSRLMTRWWSNEDAVLLSVDPERSLAGLPVERWRCFARNADALLLLGIPSVPVTDSLAGVRPRILIDQDPGYTHLWAVQSSSFEEIFGLHDLYCTVGLNIGAPRCKLPTFGVRWHPLVNPVVTAWWRQGRPPGPTFSTVADWWGQGYLEFDGKILGPKREEFLKFLDLPSLIGERIDLVLDIAPNDPDVARLKEHGWEVHSPALIDSPTAYRDWIRGSTGEFSCAKGVYVGTSSGWVSDRTACYLAAGRPAIVQDTGLGGHLPLGKGLLSVNSAVEAVEAVAAIRRDYEAHSRAARKIAREFFDYSVVLPPILKAAGIGA